MAIQAVPFALQNASHSAALFRQSASAAFATGGILAIGEMALSQQGTPNMSVVLGAGRAKVAGNSVSPPAGLNFTTQAMYDTLNDAPLTLTVTASNATNPRIDAAWVQIQDSFYSGAANTAVPGVTAGVPAPTPTPPTIPTNAILIGYIAVGANVTTIVAANISYQATLASLLPNNKTGLVSVIPSSVSVGGGSYATSVSGGITLTAATSLNINGCFIGAYDNYVVNFDAVAASTFTPLLVLSAAGTPNAAGYDQQYGYETGAGTTARTGASQVNGANVVLSAAAALEQTIQMTVFAPAVATRRTKFEFETLDYSGTAAPIITSGWTGHRSVAAFDGLQLSWGGVAISGTIRIQGYNN